MNRSLRPANPDYSIPRSRLPDYSITRLPNYPILKRPALDDAENDRRPAVVLRRRAARDLPDGRAGRSPRCRGPSAYASSFSVTFATNWSRCCSEQRAQPGACPGTPRRSASVPDASTGVPASSVRHRPIGSKFSSANPSGSIMRVAARAGRVLAVLLQPLAHRRRSCRLRRDPAAPARRAAAAAAACRGSFSSSHLPRSTGEVRFGYDVTVSRLPWPSSPPRRSSVSVTRRKRSP